MDMVDLDPNGRILRITIKPPQTHLRYTWIIAVWAGRFTDFMHEFVALRKMSQQEEQGQPELYLGDVIQAAIQERVRVENVIFNDGSYVDIETPEDLTAAVQKPI